MNFVPVRERHQKTRFHTDLILALFVILAWLVMVPSGSAEEPPTVSRIVIEYNDGTSDTFEVSDAGQAIRTTKETRPPFSHQLMDDHNLIVVPYTQFAGRTVELVRSPDWIALRILITRVTNDCVVPFLRNEVLRLTQNPDEPIALGDTKYTFVFERGYPSWALEVRYIAEDTMYQYLQFARAGALIYNRTEDGSTAYAYGENNPSSYSGRAERESIICGY